MSGALPWLVGPVAAACVALLVVRLAIGYAHRRGMLDLPGQRRSHTVPTPRGGGIGIVLACMLSMPAVASLVGGIAPATLVAWDACLLLVAGIGWWDDHRPLGAGVRLLVQCVAVALLGTVVCRGAWIWLPLVVVGGVASVNLHNFMDGIDGLLAMQGTFVGVALALLAAATGQDALALMAACLAAACAGFGWYNRSPARIFMGDVGSGSVGFLIYALVLLLWHSRAETFWPAIIVCSSFVADASLTLLCRMVQGRRWYAAHRSHLYQWLVRRGWSHRRVVSCYAGWNLLAALLALVAYRLPGRGCLIAVPFYLIACACWIIAKRRCLTLAKSSHVRA